jgi:hypothetical protein
MHRQRDVDASHLVQESANAAGVFVQKHAADELLEGKRLIAQVEVRHVPDSLERRRHIDRRGQQSLMRGALQELSDRGRSSLPGEEAHPKDVLCRPIVVAKLQLVGLGSYVERSQYSPSILGKSS